MSDNNADTIRMAREHLSPLYGCEMSDAEAQEIIHDLTVFAQLLLECDADSTQETAIETTTSDERRSHMNGPK